MNIFVILFLSGFVALGAWLSSKGVRIIASARDSIRWPTVQAVITTSELSGYRRKGGMSYEPIIEYSYTVDGQKFTGRRLRIVTQLPRSERFARECVARYPAGGAVTVAYKATDPSQAVLEPGLSKGAFIDLAGGLGFAAVALWMMLMAYLMSA